MVPVRQSNDCSGIIHVVEREMRVIRICHQISLSISCHMSRQFSSVPYTTRALQNINNINQSFYKNDLFRIMHTLEARRHIGRTSDCKFDETVCLVSLKLGYTYGTYTISIRKPSFKDRIGWTILPECPRLSVKRNWLKVIRVLKWRQHNKHTIICIGVDGGNWALVHHGSWSMTWMSEVKIK